MLIINYYPGNYYYDSYLGDHYKLIGIDSEYSSSTVDYVNEPSSNYLSWIQTGLDILGSTEIPIFSQLGDIGSAIISLGQGDFSGAMLSIGGTVIPGLSQAKLLRKAAKTGLKYSDELVKSAQKLYPNKAGKIELHHITPKYLGGVKNGPLVPLDGAYHQVITNEFRAIRPYGLGPVNEAQRLQIMKDVYSKFPLPPGYGF